MYAGTPERQRECNAAKQRRWRAANREKVAAANAAYRERNRGRRNLLYNRRWALENPEKYILSRSRTSARLRKLEHTITLADIAVPTHCPVLGVKLELFSTCGNAPSLDRIDNAKGYTPGNVIVVSHRANMLKRDATPEELRKLADFYGRQ